jgi:cytolysin-activating lysine-acyltransferase
MAIFSSKKQPATIPAAGMTQPTVTSPAAPQTVSASGTAEPQAAAPSASLAQAAETGNIDPSQTSLGQAEPLSDEEKAKRAAMARQSSAVVGDLVFLLMRDPRFKNFAIADLEWLVLPAVITGQYAMAHGERGDGVSVPIAAVLWASVSEEVDARLEENLHRPFRLTPTEWTGGEICWLAQTIGPPQMVNGLIEKLRPEHPAFKGRQVKMRVHADDRRMMVKILG